MNVTQYITYQTAFSNCCPLQQINRATHWTGDNILEEPAVLILGSLLLYYGCHVSDYRMTLELTAVGNFHPSIHALKTNSDFIRNII